MSYRLRKCSYNSRDTYIVCHGEENTIPPPVVAICNFLSLSAPAEFTPPHGHFSHKNGVSLTKNDLMQTWKSLILKAAQRDRDSAVNPALLGREVFLDFLRAGELLMGGTCLQPFHTGRTTDFCEDSKEVGYIVLKNVCQPFKIPLHHGWMVDPKDAEIYGASSSDKSNEYQKDLESVFKESTKSQLTPYGLACLTKDIEEGKLALLFRRNHLSLIRKHCGLLFVLETNDNSWNELGDVMWRTLNVTGREEAFFTSEFSPTEFQPNSEVEEVVQFIDEWKQQEEARKKEADDLEMSLLRDLGGSKPSGTKRKPAKKKKEDKHGDEPCKGSKVEQTEELSGAETAPIPPSGPTEDGNEYQWIAEGFMNFLDGFVDEDDDVPDGETNIPFYVRIVTDMKCLPRNKRSNRMLVRYPHIEKHDKKLAFAILNDWTRLNDVLTKVFVEFRVKHKCGKKEELKGKVRLLIIEMPSAERTMGYS